MLCTELSEISNNNVIKDINIKLKMKDVLTPFNPKSGIERKRTVIRFLSAIKNVINTIKFLCSEKIIRLKALTGSSIIS
jgi:predicted rRNA methylase YqxC with S4 and FtsJ domains